MKIKFFTTALVVLTILNCLPAQRLLAQEEPPSAGSAMVSKNNNIDEIPSAGSATEQKPEGSSSGSSDSYRPSRHRTRISRVEPASRPRDSETISEPKHRPRVRRVTQTTEEQTPPRRRIRNVTTPHPETPSASHNFPIRLW